MESLTKLIEAFFDNDAIKWLKIMDKLAKYRKYYFICLHNRDKEGTVKWAEKHNKLMERMLYIMMFDKPGWMKQDKGFSGDENVRLHAESMKVFAEKSETISKFAFKYWKKN